MLLLLQQRSSQREEPEARFTPAHTGDSLRVHKRSKPFRSIIQPTHICIHPPHGRHICVICVICGKTPEQSETPSRHSFTFIRRSADISTLINGKKTRAKRGTLPANQPLHLCIYPPFGGHICAICAICGKTPSKARHQAGIHSRSSTFMNGKKNRAKRATHPASQCISAEKSPEQSEPSNHLRHSGPSYHPSTPAPELPKTPGTANDPVLASNQQTGADQ